MKTKWKCPHCHNETLYLEKETENEGLISTKRKQFIFPIYDGQKNILWKNVFKIDWIMLLMLIGIIFLLIGFRQINSQCFDLIENPCEHANKAGCYCKYDTLPRMGNAVVYQEPQYDEVSH